MPVKSVRYETRVTLSSIYLQRKLEITMYWYYKHVRPKLQGCLPCSRFLARQVIEEFGSFDRYIWNFVNHRPIVSQFRYPRQVPVKTPKAEVISKDLVKRGFRSVGPTVVYSFMQVAGLTNDHLLSCFRFQECLATAAEEEGSGKHITLKTRIEKLMIEDSGDLGLLAPGMP